MVQKPVVRSLESDVVSELLALIALFNSKEAWKQKRLWPALIELWFQGLIVATLLICFPVF